MEIGDGAAGVGALPRLLLRLAAQPAAIRSGGQLHRREQPEVDVHRLERRTAGVVGHLDVAAGDVIDERAVRRRCGRHGPRQTPGLRGGGAAGEKPGGGALHIALDAGDLSGEAQPRHGVEPQLTVDEARRVEERVAVQPAEPGELGALQAGDGAEQADLLAVLQLGLEADHVVERAQRVVLAQLHHGVGLHLRVMGVGEAARLHRPVAERFGSAFGHDLDGQAAVEEGGRRLERLRQRRLSREQAGDERLVLRLVERAVDVVGPRAGRPGLVVARLAPRHEEVDGVAIHDRRDGVEEGEPAVAGQRADGVRQPGRRQRPGGDDDVAPGFRRQAVDLAGFEPDQRMRRDRRGDGARKPLAVHRQRTAGGELVGVGGGHHQRARQPHFGVEQAHGVQAGVVGAERIGADEFGEAAGPVRLGHAAWAHFMQHHAAAGVGGLPGRLASGETAADDVDDARIPLHPCHGRPPTTALRRAAMRRLPRRGRLG